MMIENMISEMGHREVGEVDRVRLSDRERGEWVEDRDAEIEGQADIGRNREL